MQILLICNTLTLVKRRDARYGSGGRSGMRSCRRERQEWIQRRRRLRLGGEGRGGQRLHHATRPVEARCPVPVVQAFDPHAAVPGRRVDEPALPDVDRDVRVRPPQRVEEHEVAGLQFRARHGVADSADLFRAPRQVPVEHRGEDMANEPAAVESCLGTAAAEAIRRSEQRQGLDHDVGPRAVRAFLRLRDDAEHGQREADHEPACPRSSDDRSSAHCTGRLQRTAK